MKTKNYLHDKMKFTKQEFINTIKAIKDQAEFDKQKAGSLSTILECDINPHDNSRLLNQLFRLLHTQFPPKGDFCLIQTFCFDLNFGKHLSTEKDPIEDLWEELINEYPIAVQSQSIH